MTFPTSSVVLSQAPVRGMHTTYDIPEALKPKNVRDALIRFDRRGASMLTGITMRSRHESTPNQQVMWGEKTRAKRIGTIVSVKKNSALTTAYTGAAKGTTVYIVVSEDDRKWFRVRDLVRLVVTNDPTKLVRVRVTSVGSYNGTHYVAGELLEADTSGYLAAGTDAEPNYISVYSDANPMASTARDSIGINPSVYTNYCQIFQQPYKLSASSDVERQLFGIREKKERIADALSFHGEDMEWTLIFGKLNDRLGENNEYEYHQMGMVDWLTENEPTNIVNFRNDTGTAYAGKAWKDVGRRWMNEKMELITRYGSPNKIAFCGSGAITSINYLVEEKGTFQFTGTTTAYGLRVKEWITPFGTLGLIEHPLLSEDVAWKNSAIIFDPGNLRMREFRKTFNQMAYRDVGGVSQSYALVDAIEGMWVTEACFEYNIPESFVIMHNIGYETNEVS